MSEQKWSTWWFLNGGMIHGLWKSRQYKKIKELANDLPKAAWDFQQSKIDKLEAENRKLKEYLENTKKEYWEMVDLVNWQKQEG